MVVPLLLGLAGVGMLAARGKSSSAPSSGGSAGSGPSPFWRSLPEKLYDAQQELIRAILERGEWSTHLVTEQRSLPDGRTVKVTVPVTNAIKVDGVRVSSLKYPFAQQLADELELLLPTPRIADMVHRAAVVNYGAEKVFIPLAPVISAGCPLNDQGEPTACRNTTKTATLKLSAVDDELAQGRDALADNEGKWFVLSKKVFDDPSRSGIYGWWRSDGVRVQNNITAHFLNFGDYSQVIRFVGPTTIVRIGDEPPQPMNTADIYTSSDLAFLLSDDGPLPGSRHPGVKLLPKGALRAEVA